MRPRIVDALNAAFHSEVPGALVPTPAVVYAIAMLAVLVVFVQRCERAGLSRYHAVGAGLWTMIGGLVGARVIYLLFRFESTMADPRQILDLGGGTASWGGYLLGVVALLLHCRRHQQPAWQYADALASCLGLGVAIGRWSCFLNGDDYGRISSVAWAVRFPHASYPFVAQVRAGHLDPLADLSLPVHPVQLYLSLNGLILFVGASLLWKRLRHRPGTMFCLYWLAYCATRFLWEFARGDQPDVLGGFVTIGQLVCVPIGIGAGLCLRTISTRWRSAPP